VRERLLRILDLGTAPGDDPDLVLRKRTSVATILVICLGFLTFMTAGVLTDRPVLVAQTTLVLLGQAVNLGLFHRTKRIGPSVAITVVIGYLAVFAGILALGGMLEAPGNFGWGLLAPMGAILLLGGRAWLPVYLGLAAFVGLAILLDPLIDRSQALPDTVLLFLSAFDILGPAAVATGLVLFIDGQRQEARRQSDALLRNILPDPVAARLKAGERVIADHYDDASVLFADIVNFTPLADARAPQEVVSVLNGLFTEFDRLADELGLEKIKTIGDSYMAVVGVPEHREDHAAVAMEMALAMHALVAAQPAVDDRHRLEIRCGIASGPLVAGVIGERKFSYDLWGDTVNVAARMESSGIPGCIQVTDETHRLLGDRYPFERREGVEVKGKGEMTTWTLDPSTLR
jgi:class 3 adenylate cyclase